MKKKSKTKKKKKVVKKSPVSNIISRYLVLVLLIFPFFNLTSSLWDLVFVRFILTPLTVYPVYFFLNIFFNTSLFSDTVILINGFFPIELVPACIAGSAYYLLLLLNLSTPKIKSRFKLIILSFFSLLVLNVLRILILSILAFNDYSNFDATHKFFWYSLSTIFIVAIWFFQVKKFKIKEIPFYSDLKLLVKKSKK